MRNVKLNIGVICLGCFLLSCAKDFRTENDLKSGSGSWKIEHTVWHGISNLGLIEVDTAGELVLPGYFEFDKDEQGLWYCETDSVFGSDLGVGGSFDWHVKNEEIDIYSYATEPADLSEHPLFYETWSSFKGNLSDGDKDYMTVQGYFKRAWTDGDYIILFAEFSLKKE